ncbi:MAG: hypothetical protein KJP05_09235 [Deltaproteobacteria bacterium]|nr:hypothetical protein [Deltaproteobacteria bacterium]
MKQMYFLPLTVYSLDSVATTTVFIEHVSEIKHYRPQGTVSHVLPLSRQLMRSFKRKMKREFYRLAFIPLAIKERYSQGETHKA